MAALFKREGRGGLAEEGNTRPWGSSAETKARPLPHCKCWLSTSTASMQLDESIIKVVSYINFINKIRNLKRE